VVPDEQAVAGVELLSAKQFSVSFMPFPGAQISREPAQAAGEGGLSCTGQHGDAGADGGVEVGLGRRQ